MKIILIFSHFNLVSPGFVRPWQGQNLIKNLNGVFLMSPVWILRVSWPKDLEGKIYFYLKVEWRISNLLKASIQIAIGFISNDRNNLPAPVLCSREAWQDQDFPLRNKDFISLTSPPCLGWILTFLILAHWKYV